MSATRSDGAGRRARGSLVIIGGAEDRGGDKAVLSRVVELAGGDAARIVVLTTASRLAHEQPAVAKEFADTYEGAFSECGAREVQTLHIHDRAAANADEYAGVVGRATGVFMTGGDQGRLASILAGTAVGEAMQRAYHEVGACISGTSAGASAISEHMIAGGPADLLPKKGALPLAAGLGFLRRVLIDQHFSERRRFGRLLSVIAQNPSLLGIGIDEDTALVVLPSGGIEVVGAGAVTLLDGRRVAYSNFNEVDRGEVLALIDVKLHLLPAGARFELEHGANDRVAEILATVTGRHTP
jgi:cyanophycinase